jgi:quinol monooxygenase YgiN
LRERERKQAPFSFTFTDRRDQNLFVIYEVWKDVQALRAHFKTAYVQQFVLDSADYVDGNMGVQWLVMASEYTAGK